jgi:hypothetical protein
MEVHVTISLPDDETQISWASGHVGIGTSTAHRLVAADLPGFSSSGSNDGFRPQLLAEVQRRRPERPHPGVDRRWPCPSVSGIVVRK